MVTSSGSRSMPEGKLADLVFLKRQSDVGLGLDRVHVEKLGRRRDGTHGGKFRRRGDIETVDTDLVGQHFQHHGLAVGLDGIGGLARKRILERASIGGEHVRPETVDRNVRSQG